MMKSIALLGALGGWSWFVVQMEAPLYVRGLLLIGGIIALLFGAAIVALLLEPYHPPGLSSYDLDYLEDQSSDAYRKTMDARIADYEDE